jgi:thioesterase domain-containing protein
MTMDDLRRTEEFLHAQIPLARAMGIRVVTDERAGFAIEAPVALNYNHLRTAFGGSVNAVATLAAYAFLWLRTNDDAVHVIVRESSIRFARPICEMIRAQCEQPRTEALRTFDDSLRERGKARLQLRVNVEEAGSLAAEFTGTFVAMKDR